MSVKERLTAFLSRENISKSEFGRAIGVSNAYISSIRKSIQPDKIRAIALNYPDLNIDWLMTGEGEMIKGEIAESKGYAEIGGDKKVSTPLTRGKVVPFYEIQAAAGTSYGMEMTPASPSSMINITGLLGDSEAAIRIYGNSMMPNYPAGCIVGTKVHTDSFIVPGNVYLIETRDNRYLKRLYYNKDKSAYRCVSDNTSKHNAGVMEGEFFFPDFEIPFAEVIRLHQVTGVIKRNGI